MLTETKRTDLFCEYYAKWITVYKKGAIRKVTMDKYLMTQKWLVKLVPNLRVCDMNRIAYQQLLNDYAEFHERQTTMDFHHQLKGAILDAVDEGLIERDPTRKAIIKGKPPVAKKIKYLNQFELHTLLISLDLKDMLSENKKRMVVAICAEEEISSIEWARLKKDKWVNRSISCPEYVQSIYKMMNWNKECRYKIYGRLANSERGLVLVFDLASAVMFDPLPEEYFDKHTGKMKKRIVKYYPDEIRMKLGRSYSDYEALQQRSSFESLSGYMDTSGGAVPATVSEELAASISMQEQEKKRETLFGTIIGNGGDDDVRNNE